MKLLISLSAAIALVAASAASAQPTPQAAELHDRTLAHHEAEEAHHARVSRFHHHNEVMHHAAVSRLHHANEEVHHYDVTH